MSDDDRLDDLLTRAFAADRAAHPPASVVRQVMERIRVRQRNRALVLGGAAAAALLLGAGLCAPLLLSAAGTLADDVARWSSHGGLLAILTAAGVGWLVLEEEVL